MTQASTDLLAGEEILVRMRPAAKSFAVFILGMLICAIGPFVAQDPPLRPATGLVLALVFLLIILRRWSNVYTLTNRRLISRGGLFAREANEIQVADISAVQVHQGFALRLLGAGHIIVRSRKPDESSLLMYGIPSPMVFRSQLEELAGLTAAGRDGGEPEDDAEGEA